MPDLKKLKNKIKSKKYSNRLYWKFLFFIWATFKSKYPKPKAVIHTFPKQKVIDVEVPKAGCTSIKWALKKFKGYVNDSNEDIHKFYGYPEIPTSKLKKEFATKYHDWVKFTVVRNPYSRFLSFYNDKTTSPEYKDTLHSKKINEVLKNLFKKYKTDNHVKRQTDLIGKDLKIYDFVGKTEDMENVFRFLSKVFMEEIKYTHENKSDQKAKLKKTDKEKIYKLYKKDFKILKYKKSQ